MITVDQHLDRILATAEPLPAERVPLAEAGGRCIAEDLASLLAVPPWDNSAMDGYAVRFEEIAEASANSPVELRVVADLPAGTSLRPSVGPGEAARIMTGAPVPTGVDAVVPVELTDGGTSTVRVTASPGERRHIRRAGEDRLTGDPAVTAGTEATPEVISSLASTGYGTIPVRRQPRLAVISTGDELVDPGTTPGYGQIPDSNSLLVAGLARESKAEVVAVRRVGDTADELEAAIADCSHADLIVMTGGVSVGAFDPVKSLFADGQEVRFDRVCMQPGKPQAFGRLNSGPLVFGLPGNPVSVWASFHVFVRPCLRLMRGCAELLDLPVPARASTGWRGPQGRVQYLPAVITAGERGLTVTPAATGGSGSHLVASLAAANGYAIVAVDATPVKPGDTVPTVLTRPELPNPGVQPAGSANPASEGESSA